MRWAALALAALLAGCATPAPPAPGPGLHADLALSEQVEVLGALAREPAIVESRAGLWVAGYQYGTEEAPVLPFVRPALAEPPLLWRSGDQGASWQPVDLGQPADLALGNSDVDLAAGPSDEVYVIAMTFSQLGHTIAAGASLDDGATWRWSLLAAEPLADRPWVAVAPEGMVHAIWNTGRVYHARSADRGATWSAPALVAPLGGSAHLDVGPGGEVAVRVTPASASGYLSGPTFDGVVVSTDAGATWTERPLPGNRSWGGPLFTGGGDATPRWADPLAFDAAGTLYAAWGEGEALRLARSRDLGASWDVVELAREPGAVLFYPYLRGGAAGELGASWFALRDGNVTAHVAHVLEAHRSPRVRAAGFEPDIRDPDGAESSGGEYFQVALLRAGGLGFASTVQRFDEGRLGFAFRTAR